MILGVITYYKVANFGANLQAISTYCYLKNHGHEPVFINFMSENAHTTMDNKKNTPEWEGHLNIVDSIIKEQTEVCYTSDDIINAVKKYNIEGIIIGSDALLQHHPLLSRIRKGRRKPIFIEKVDKMRLFPNPFWGVKLSDKIPVGLLSVSSQNSAYKLFSSSLKEKMGKSLSNMKYISVRDNWTRDMVASILPNRYIPITPDPVFGFNYNATDLIPTKDELLTKFKLPHNYVLISMFDHNIPMDVMKDLKLKLNYEEVVCVVLHTPTGRGFEHPFDYEIKPPLSPLEWYGLIKNANAYVGCNMHPIVVSLANAVPCFSMDNWGKIDFWGKKKNDGSSKVLHIMKQFGVDQNHRFIQEGRCCVTADDIIKGIKDFPVSEVRNKATEYLANYKQLMKELIDSLA